MMNKACVLNLFLLLTIFVINSCNTDESEISVISNSSIGNERNINCNTTEAQAIASSTPTIEINGSNYYIGYRQVSANDQNPIILKFTNGVLDWCREDYDTTADDGRGYGLFWSGTNLYGIFSITGTQCCADQQISRFTTNGWLTGYGQGGGARVSIILDINPDNGTANFGTFLMSRLNSGNANSLIVNDIFLDDTNLVVKSNAFFSPLNTNRSRMDCTGDSPFDYTIIFEPNLQTAVCASAVGCTNSNAIDCSTY